VTGHAALKSRDEFCSRPITSHMYPGTTVPLIPAPESLIRFLGSVSRLTTQVVEPGDPLVVDQAYVGGQAQAVTTVVNLSVHFCF